MLPARIADYQPSGLDTLIAAGEVAWAGVEPIGERDGRIALFLADKLPLLALQRPIIDPLTEREEKLLAVLESTGASFFDPLHQALGAAIPAKPWMPSGLSSGAASSPTTRSTPSAPTSPALKPPVPRAVCKQASSVPAAPRHPPRKAAGRSCLCGHS